MSSDQHILKAWRFSEPSAYDYSFNSLNETGKRYVVDARLQYQGAEETLDQALAWRNTFVERRSENQATVLLDTTTIHSAFELVQYPQDNVPLGFRLWDLFTLTLSIIVFDRIFFFDAGSANADPTEEPIRAKAQYLNNFFGEEVFLALPVGEDSVLQPICYAEWCDSQRTISDLANSDKFHKHESELSVEYVNAWSSFLGVEVGKDDLFDESYFTDRYSSVPELLLPEIVSQTLDDVYVLRNRWHRVIAECNVREEFNTRLAQFLGIPYLPNSFRAPVRSIRHSRAREVTGFLSSISYLDDSYREKASTYASTSPTRLTLPVFLAAVIQRIDNLADFWLEVASLRTSAEPFRRRRAELDRAVAVGNVKEMDKLSAALSDETAKTNFWSNIIVEAGAGAGAILLHDYTTLLSTASVGLLLLYSALRPLFAKSTVATWLAPGLTRLFRPSSWMITNIGQSAMLMTNASPKIDRLWRGGFLEEAWGATAFVRLQTLGYG